ncbi:hypothetical protein, partial [Tritonibacter sp. SIMBA_163]|uniref:hypothetical protein n=1 Tax=Tritonibacter sp. SIMBA_163 TaxID=3080868 RepID=UPI00397FE044
CQKNPPRRVMFRVRSSLAQDFEQTLFCPLIRDYIEDIQGKREKLLVIIETNGGSIETAERIADVFRYHYPGEVNFLV